MLAVSAAAFFFLRKAYMHMYVHVQYILVTPHPPLPDLLPFKLCACTYSKNWTYVKYIHTYIFLRLVLKSKNRPCR